MPDRAAHRVLEAWTDRLRERTETLERAQWEAACRASPENRSAVEEAARALDAARHDPQGFARIEQSLAERIDEPTLARALERLRLRLLPHQKPRPDALITLEAGVEEQFSRFRALVGSRRLTANDVTRALRTSVDPMELEETWRGAIAVGERVQDDVRELVRLRNQHARSLGQPDYRTLALRCEEVDPVWLDAFLGDLARGTADAWRQEKRAVDEARARTLGLEPESLRPWHYGDVFLQTGVPEAASTNAFAGADLVALTQETFRRVGLDVSPVFEHSDLFPREGKNQHAFCTHLDRAGDVRVLCNVVPDQRWAGTMLHEFGHAAYDRGLDFDLPWNLVVPAHPGTTEAVAMLFGRLAHDPGWRSGVAGLEADPAEAERGRRSLLAFVRWALVVSVFERHLYADPEQDLDRVWWDLVRRYQGIERPDPVPPGSWAAKIHIACFPVYYHSYLMGETIASQLARHLNEASGDRPWFERSESGAYLREKVFRPSATVPFTTLVERATGAQPRASALLEDLAPATGGPACT